MGDGEKRDVSKFDQYLEVETVPDSHLSIGRHCKVSYVLKGKVVSTFYFMEFQRGPSSFWMQVNSLCHPSESEGVQIARMDTRLTPIHGRSRIKAFEMTFPQLPNFYAKYENAEVSLGVFASCKNFAKRLREKTSDTGEKSLIGI